MFLVPGLPVWSSLCPVFLLMSCKSCVLYLVTSPPSVCLIWCIYCLVILLCLALVWFSGIDIVFVLSPTTLWPCDFRLWPCLRAPPVSLWGTFLCTLPVPSFQSPLFLSLLFLEPIWLSVPGFTALGVIPSPVGGPSVCRQGSHPSPPCFWACSSAP